MSHKPYARLEGALEPNKPLFDYARVLTTTFALVAAAALSGRALYVSPQRDAQTVIFMVAWCGLAYLVVMLVSRCLFLTAALLTDMARIERAPRWRAALYFVVWMASGVFTLGLAGLVVYAGMAAVGVPILSPPPSP